MGRINVFIGDGLLKDIDLQADREQISRSALLQRAAADYLERARAAREAEERKAHMQEACRRMDDLAKKLGKWDPVKVIRGARDARRKSA
jgi:metal-responsive CopG/Arc/MetJ family transcriptional regulator